MGFNKILGIAVGPRFIGPPPIDWPPGMAPYLRRTRMEPEIHTPRTTTRQETSSDPPNRAAQTHPYSRIDREHPIGGEMSDILRGILVRMRLPWLLQHYSRIPILALFSFI